MIYQYEKKNVPLSRTLRKNMTPEEKHLWYDFLKRLPCTVNRQKPIGNYIVDFFIAQGRIVIELDGMQHGMNENREADKIRDNDLRELGITVLRYTNTDVKQNYSGVCEDILKHLGLSMGDLKPLK